MDHHQSNSLQYRNISLLVRPARVAVLIPKMDQYWKHVMLEIFEWCSRVWGGAYFLIIPTDGKEIKTPFWKILEEYSPDHVASFTPTFQDLEFADPESYSKTIAQYRSSFLQQSPELTETHFKQMVEHQLNSGARFDFEIEKQLQQQIKQRLTPFYHQDYVVKQHVSAQAHVPFPLTQITHIVKQGGLEKVCVVDKLDDIDCSLVFYSNWGLYKTDFEKLLTEKGIEVNHLPKEARLSDLLHFSINKGVDSTEIKFRKQFPDEYGKRGASWYPDEDVTRFCPYEASLLQVGRYKALDPYYGDEPVTLVVGDTVEDFCLYYSLSRIQDAVYWMPEVKIDSKIRNDSEQSARNVLSTTVYRVMREKVNFGHSQNNIVISSLSLSQDELENAKSQLSKLSYIDGEFGQRVSIESSPWSLGKSTFRLIEQDNYTSIYTEVFQNNKGVGRVPTPKPKNFGQVIPYDHRWITELNIDGYTPPQLHFLGREIVDLRGLADETRVAKTGICYTCPNVGYFGGDIDVTLVRPRLNIIEPLTIFQKYFGEAGYVDVRYSDKGAYTKETIEKFGSLENVGSFIQKKSIRDLLSLFLTKKSFKDPDNGEVVSANGRAYLNFQAMLYLVGTKEETIELVDSFIRKGILYRGTMLHCSRCREADWYGLDELDQMFICHRCKQRQIIQQKNWKDGNELTLFYKLDEIIYQGLNNHMILPLLTLIHLKKNAKSNFVFVPELEIRQETHASKPKGEIDICCIKDGRIILGECRTDAISKDLVDKLNSFSKKLLKAPDELVFATLSSKVDDKIVSHAESTIHFPFTFLSGSNLVSDG